MHVGDEVGEAASAPSQCCVLGYPGNKASGIAKGRDKLQGNTPLQSFAWASYISPGIYARPNSGTDWALQDIHAVRHEIAEWADYPLSTTSNHGCPDRTRMRVHGRPGDPGNPSR